MAFPQIGLSILIDDAAIKRCLAARFPRLGTLTMEEACAAPWQPIVFATTTNQSEFPTLVDFAAFPGESGTEVAIGLALAKLFSQAFGCRAISDGSGLGDDSSPYWSIIQEDGRAFLADDSGSAFVDGEGGAVRVIRELQIAIGEFDDEGLLDTSG